MASAQRRRLRYVLIAAAALILYLPGLGRPALWEPDEGRYAEIAREMYLTGDYVTPRDDWVRYFEKPPLVYWAEAAAVSIFGINEFAIRLPAALFSAGEVVITAALAGAMAGEAAGTLAAVALALMPLFFGFARFATLDPALAFFMTAALGAFYMSARAPDFATGAGRRWFLLSAAMLALGTLTKGPVAPALCGAIALIWILIERRSREITHMPWISSIAVYGAIAAPWFALAARRNPGFIDFFFIHEHLYRYLANTEHGWGSWFFVPIVIGGAWPWLFFVPIGLSDLRNAGSPARNSHRSALRFLAIWFLVIFIFFSIPRAKLGSYVLPALPALAIVAGMGIARLWIIGAQPSRRIIASFAAINAIAAGALAIAVFAMRDRIPSAALAIDAYVIAALFAAAAMVACVLDRDGTRPGAAVIAISLGTILVMGTAARARTHAAALTTDRTLALQLAPYLRPGCILGSYRHIVHSLPFYTGFREALISYRGELGPFGDTPDAAASFIANDDELGRLWSSNRCVVIVANRSDLSRLANLTPPPIMIGCEGKKVALSNDRDAHPRAECADGGG